MENNKALGGIPTARVDYARNGLDPASLAVLREG
jgi:hypothetical protein